MKKTIALIIATLLIDIAVISSYVMPVEASVPALPFDGLYQSFSQIFGNAWGYFKSTDQMTYNVTIEKVQEIYESLSQDIPEIIEATGIPFNVLSYDEMMQGMQSSYEDVVAYNAGSSANDFYDKLNEQSYQASGTLATKTLEASLKKSLEFLSAMTPQQYRTGMDVMFNSLFTEEGALAVDDMKQNFMFYESFMNTMIAGQQVGAINEAWFTPVENSVYSLYDIYLGKFKYGDEDIPLYELSSFEYWSTDGTLRYKIELSDKCLILPALVSDSGAFNIEILNDENFTFDLWTYNRSGEVQRRVNFGSNWIENGAYSIGCSIPNSSRMPLRNYTIPNSNDYTSFIYAYRDYFVNYYLVDGLETEGESISAKAPGLSLALDSFWNKDITAEDVNNLAGDLAGISSVAGTDAGITTLTDVVAGLTVTLPDSITDAKNDVVTAVEGVGEKILTLPKAIWLEFADVLEGIKAKAEAIDTTKPWEGDFDSNSNDFVIILNGLLLLIMIILALLRIFIHCLQFIINIFKIPASTAFLPDDLITGLDYIKTLTIPGIGMSVYSFMMGLVYIMIVFYAVKILRVNVDRLRVPKAKNGGLN